MWHSTRLAELNSWCAGCRDGNSALHLACQANRLSVIHLLLQWGAKTDLANVAGYCPVKPHPNLGANPACCAAFPKACCETFTRTSSNLFNPLRSGRVSNSNGEMVTSLYEVFVNKCPLIVIEIG